MVYRGSVDLWDFVVRLLWFPEDFKVLACVCSNLLKLYDLHILLSHKCFGFFSVCVTLHSEYICIKVSAGKEFAAKCTVYLRAHIGIQYLSAFQISLRRYTLYTLEKGKPASKM